MDADSILNIKTPEELFDDPNEIKKKFRELSLKWHPDVALNSGSVFQHINELYKQALEKVKVGNWKSKHYYQFKSKTGTIYILKNPQVVRTFELGEYVVNDENVVYLIDKQHRDLYSNAYHLFLNGFKFASASMEKEAARYLPKPKIMEELEDGRYCIVIPKTKDLICLRDVLEYYKGEIPVKHTAWIVSSLQNIVCYLDYAEISHQDISLDNYFISPEYHSGALLGGWWYALKLNSTIKKLPARTYRLLPWKVKNNKKSKISTDLELVRAVGRECLGDVHGNKKLSAPNPISEFLKSVSKDTAIGEYMAWRRALEDGFGKRTFEVMNLKTTDVYKEN